ncbi:MAG: phosphodiesterase [Steroidobacteraceae bacterium]
MPSACLVHFTDSHLYGDAAQTLRGVATLRSLEMTRARAREDERSAHAILVTGDLVQDDPGGYAHFRAVFGSLGKPVLCLPGNHDLLPEMRRALSEPPFQYGGWYDVESWRIVLLDSVVAGQAGGRLARAELARLDETLATASGRHALVCLHHQPVPMASRWLDEVGLENPDDFFAVIDRHRHVRSILWGHVHQAYDGLRKGVRLLATPATCGQFLPQSDEFAVDEAPPAYRTLELRENGTLGTRLVWVDEFARATHAAQPAA